MRIFLIRKLNNGIILCWGNVAGCSVGSSTTTTLPLTFTTFYSLVTGGNQIDLTRNNLLAQYGCWYMMAVTDKTLSNFRYTTNADSSFVVIGI